MITHFYTARSYPHGRASFDPVAHVRLLCTKQVLAIARHPAADAPEHAVTMPHNVDCPACLRLLIPKAEKQLDAMKQVLALQSQREAM